MNFEKDLRKQLTERLKPLSPERAILFGSYAYGYPHIDSDVDLMVVLKDDFMPCSFEENMQLYLKVSTAIRDLKRKFPIDLIVYTSSMYDKLMQNGSSFLSEITAKGISLL